MDNSIILNTKKYLGRKQIVLDCKFQIESGREVQKILAVNGCPILNDVIVSNGNVSFNGKVNLKLIYLSEAGERECLNCIADFNEVYENEDIEVGDTILIDFKVVDVTTPSIKANEVKVACILDAVIYLSKNKIYEQVQEIDNVFYKKNLCEITRQVAVIKDNFDLQEEIKIDGELKSILNIDANIVVKDAYCGSGFVVVGGDANLNILYEDYDSQIKMYKTSVNVKQEISINNITKDCMVVAEMKPFDYLSKYSIIQGDNCNIINFEAPINVSGIIYENVLVDKITDAYSSEFICNLEHIECETINNLVVTNVEDTIKGEVPLKENKDAVFLGYIFSGVEVSSAYIENDKLNVEGVVSTTILYKDEDNIIQSAIAEFPYISQISKPEFGDVTEVSVKASIIDIDVSLKNNSVELVAKLQFNVFGVNSNNLSLINGLELNEKRIEKDYAMEILVVGNEQSLWDIGKKLGVGCEQIVHQNPNLVEPLKKGDKIVVYYSCNK